MAKINNFCKTCSNLIFKNFASGEINITKLYRPFSNLKAFKEKQIVNHKISRTHTCGELNASHVKQNVTLCGWLEYQRMNCFAVLRDGYGSTQIIIPAERKDLEDLLKNTPLESAIAVQGIVKKRPENQVKDSSTGEVEVVINDFNILNAVKTKLPFSIRQHGKATEHLRIKYRYLDLRYPEMQRNLRERSRFLMKIRNFLHEEGFVEVETPTLFKKTPGGAQEFIVPTKTPGEFFSLVQSPQQLKQLLMVGSIDKYFQIARCYRDESARPDRQPEFTQMDLEMSFCSVEDIINVIENLIANSWPKTLKTPFRRMTYAEAFRFYGTDQPDISFKCLITEVKSISNERKNDGTKTYAVKIPQAAGHFNNSVKKELFKVLKGIPAKVEILRYLAESVDVLENTLEKFNIDPKSFIDEVDIKPGDIVFISHGEANNVLQALGKSRVWFLRWLRGEGLNGEWDSEDRGTFLWLTDFPLFEPSPDGALKSVHHPFTMPHPEDMHLLYTNPLQVRSLHYDLVLDGYEVGGGSVRLHDSHLQKEILSLLKIPTESLQHLLDALASGAPPHAGIALGIDRLVSIMVGAKTIRDVIAFPKTSDGKDALSGAPSSISSEELKHYNISVIHS